MMRETLAQVTAPPRGEQQGFCAGLVLWNDRVVVAADIVRHMNGWHRDKVRAYCAERGWRVSVVHEIERQDPRRR